MLAHRLGHRLGHMCTFPSSFQAWALQLLQQCLEDKKGNKVKNIKVSERGDPVDITVEILKQWERERASYMADISDMFMSHKLKCSGR